jgi:hypothetical protein
MWWKLRSASGRTRERSGFFSTRSHPQSTAATIWYSQTWTTTSSAPAPVPEPSDIHDPSLPHPRPDSHRMWTLGGVSRAWPASQWIVSAPRLVGKDCRGRPRRSICTSAERRPSSRATRALVASHAARALVGSCSTVTFSCGRPLIHELDSVSTARAKRSIRQGRYIGSGANHGSGARAGVVLTSALGHSSRRCAHSPPALCRRCARLDGSRIDGRTGRYAEPHHR